ncbi:MAG: ring-1,2-phenylacetyl-CoA epoxidase subunit PaaE [Salibacteraceae bacterium]|jgi:ring-1,2-phenylacetyl-CoA epoxidase subunit PaaE
MQFNTLVVTEVRKETSDTVSVAFSIPKDIQSKEYNFIPGQYITLKAMINGEDVRRAYSICSSPYENELRVAIKKVPKGIFSTYANTQLKAGDTLEVMTPMGHFHSEYKAENSKSYVLFAAGSGITPILSIIKHVLHTEANSTITLLYGNKEVDSIIFGKEIDAIKNDFPARFSFQLVFSREDRGVAAFYGRINAEKLPLWGKALFDVNATDEFFMCGPEGMTNDIIAYLKEQNVADSKVHFELFHAEGSTTKVALEEIPESNNVNASITIIMDDERYDFTLKTQGTDILQAGVEDGLDLPFSCKGGVCCTCKAKLLEGSATMTKNYSLLDEEVAAGYILTCQAHPTTEKVVVSFDD